MPKDVMHRTKLIVLYDYFKVHTDEQHPKGIKDIISHLESCSIPCERKAIYDDIEALRSVGADIVMTREGNRTVYFLASRTFETAELKMLVDIIGASRFITARKSSSLIRKIGTLCSEEEAKSLSREIILTGRVKTENETIYLNVDMIHTAFREGSRISFKYFNYDHQKKKQYRNLGSPYNVVPVALVWNNDNYYLVAYRDGIGEMRHFRVDKMDSVTLGSALTPDEKKLVRDYDTSRFSRVIFDMYGGDAVRVELSCTEPLVNSMLDRFGLDLVLRNGENGQFLFNVEVELSPTFFAWVTTFGGDVKLLSPQSAVDGFRVHLEKIMASIGDEK